jgi:putative sensory transduction regulator
VTATSPSRRDAAIETVRAALLEVGLAVDETAHGVFAVELPGEHKLAIPCRLSVGEHAFSVDAFVCRNPDENHAGVYRWLLGRNLRMYGMAFAVDRSGDIYLSGRLSLAAVTATEVDRVLGSVASYCDESFNTILELGFASSIRREWHWRLSRGESTRNLDAFRGWLEREGEEPGQ